MGPKGRYDTYCKIKETLLIQERLGLGLKGSASRYRGPIILVSRGRAHFGQHQEECRPLGRVI